MRKNNNLIISQTRCLNTDQTLEAGMYKSIEYRRKKTFTDANTYVAIYYLRELIPLSDPLYKEFQHYCVGDIIQPEVIRLLLKESGFNNPFEHPDDASDLFLRPNFFKNEFSSLLDVLELEAFEDKAKESNLPRYTSFDVHSGANPEFRQGRENTQWVSDVRIISNIGHAWNLETFNEEKAAVLSKLKNKLEEQETSTSANALIISISLG